MYGYLSSTYSLLRLWIQILNVLIPINVSVVKNTSTTNTTTLIHDLTFDVSTFKGIILKQLIQGIAFKDYTSCQVMKELSYGSEYNKKRRPIYRFRFP